MTVKVSPTSKLLVPEIEPTTVKVLLGDDVFIPTLVPPLLDIPPAVFADQYPPLTAPPPLPHGFAQNISNKLVVPL